MSTRDGNGNSTIHRLHLYYVRIHHVKDDIKLEAKFGKNLSFSFNEGERLSNQENVGPVLYTLVLKLKQDNNKHLSVYHIDEYKPCSEYRLSGSHIKIKTIKHEEKQIESRSLFEYFNKEHVFLFDVQFDSAYFSNFPGKTKYINVKSFQIFLFLLQEKIQALLLTFVYTLIFFYVNDNLIYSIY